MKTKDFFQPTNRFAAALVLSCFLLIGVAGARLASNHQHEAPAYSEPADDDQTTVALSIEAGSKFWEDGKFWSNGNFWSA